MSIMRWDVDEYDDNGKLVVLYRFIRPFSEGVIKSGDYVLDVGGWGKLEHRLSQEGCKVDMVNIDQEECNRAAKRYGGSFTIRCTDIRNDSGLSNIYDVVTCFETLEHITEHREEAINVMMGLLKDGGKFVGTIPIPGRCHPVGDPTVVFITPEELREILSKYSDDIFIEPTGSISKDETPCSWYFVATKRKAL
jgi:SAM-dependent methyltransferase